MSEPRLSEHPRAVKHIRTAKGWGGIGGFAVVAWTSHKAGVPSPDVVLRGIAGGLVGWALAWMVAVQVWRQLAIAEVRRREREWRERRERLEAAIMENLDETMVMKPGGNAAA